MAKQLFKMMVVVWMGIAIIGCAAKKPQKSFDAGELRYDNGAASNAGSGLKIDDREISSFPSSVDVDIDQHRPVNNFHVILDASGSKYLPYSGLIKLKIAKDVLRRFNQKTPERPLTGGLRRYGFEAGAFTVKTEIIYGITSYDRQDYADAIEIIRWAGGKSPLALAIDESSNDMSVMEGDMSLVIISDGNIYENDPVEAAKRIKQRYGDRICIYTCFVGETFKIKGLDVTNQRMLEMVAEAGGCGYAITADELGPDDKMQDWVDDIFNRGNKLRRGPSMRDLGQLGPCPDEDGDGVCDHEDQCPGTPKGAKVDSRGCWLIGRVQFELDKYKIRPEYYSIIDEVIHVMKLNPDISMKVEGHTCIIASEKYNIKLSNNRAKAVADYMIKKGIEPGRIAMEGFAYHRPSADNKTSDGRSQNRRAEFVPSRR